MQRIAVNAEAPDAASISLAASALRRGEVVAFPTDTLYGLAVDPRNGDAVARLFALKAREARSAVPLVAGGLEQAERAGEFGPLHRRLAESFWPGPLSIVVPARPAIARSALGGGDTIAIRVPAHRVARALASSLGFCVTATSANTSGRPPASGADAVARTLPGVDVVLDGGNAPGGPPSTIVAFDANGPVLVRAGAIAWDRVLKSLQ